MNGQFVWYDLMTSDSDAAKKFYRSLFGWRTRPWEHSTADNPYTMWTLRGTTLGGVMPISDEQRRQGVPPHWLSSVQVRNVDDSARQAQSLGARVVYGPTGIPDTGRYAILQDPQGAMIAIFQPQAEMAGFDGTPSLGRVSWNELMTTDFRMAFDFYRQMFGWEKTGEFDMGGGQMYLMCGMKGRSFGGMFNRPPEMQNVPPFWLPYVNVKNVKQSAAAASRAGARLVNGPMEVPGGDWIAVFGDPQGAAFAIHQVAPKQAAKPKTGAKAKPKRKWGGAAKPKSGATARTKSRIGAKSRAGSRAKPATRARAWTKSKKKARRR